MIKMSARFILHYKMQSLAILLSMVLSIALLTGISSLVYSGHMSDLENCREIYGDWNCRVPYTQGMEGRLAQDASGYMVEKYGLWKIAGQLEEDSQLVTLLYADETYLEMMGQPVVDGYYPKENGEIAMDQFTLDNMEIEAAPGDSILLGGIYYRLSGILKNPWSSDSLMLTAYVSSSAAAGADTSVYLKLDSSKKVYRQIEALANDLDIDAEDILLNSRVNKYLGQDGFGNIVRAVKNTISDSRYNFTYLLLVLKDGFGLTVNGIIFGLGFFSLFIIYSIFNINIAKRISVYGILHALGISCTGQFLLVLAELWCLLAVGFPTGAFLGNACAKTLYDKFNTVFIDKDVVSGSHGDPTRRFEEAARLSVQGFSVSRGAILFGFAFLSAAMVFLAWRLAHKIGKMTAVQMMKPVPDRAKRGRNVIYSRKGRYMPGVVNWEFMFAKKRSLAGMLISLSIGGVIFLCANFVLGNAKLNSQMQLASDDGLGSDLKIYENNRNLKEMISQDTADAVGNIKGVEKTYAIKSYIGEMILNTDELLWKTYFDGLNREDGKKWNGVCNELPNGGYAIKTNILGYDDGLLEQLRPYLIGEGNLAGEHMRTNNQVVLTVIEDSQGNHDGIAVTAGDVIRLKVPKKLQGSSKDLKMSDREDAYEEKKFTVSAVVSRPLIRDSRLYYLDRMNMDAGVSVIMTQEQMAQNFGLEGYRVIGMELEPDADTEKTAQAVKEEISGIESLIFQDYTGSIERQNEYLGQKMLFFSSVAAMFFIISMFHIMNAMSHMILSRKHEFGVMRAVGTSDRNIARMMAGQGFVYGCLSAAVMTGVYFVVKKAAVYFMVHVYGFLVSSVQVNPIVIVATAVVNIIVSIFSVMLPAYMILREEIIPQINLQ